MSQKLNDYQWFHNAVHIFLDASPYLFRLHCYLFLYSCETKRTPKCASEHRIVTYATDAVKLGVQGAFITDGRVPHALLNEILAGGAEGLGSGGGGTVVTL